MRIGFDTVEQLHVYRTRLTTLEFSLTFESDNNPDSHEPYSLRVAGVSHDIHSTIHGNNSL